MAGPGSSDLNNAQTVSKTEGSNVSGTQCAFNTSGEGAEIMAEDATINSGYGAGNAKHIITTGNDRKNALEGCCGTKNAFNADSGGKINLTGATVNSGAFAGNGVTQPKVTMNVAAQLPVPGRSVTGGYEGELDSKPKMHFDDMSKH